MIYLITIALQCSLWFSPVCFTLFRRKELEDALCQFTFWRYVWNMALDQVPTFACCVQNAKGKLFRDFLILMICVLLCRESALATDVCLKNLGSPWNNQTAKMNSERDTHFTDHTFHKTTQRVSLLAHNLLNSHTYKRAVLTSLDFRAIQWFRKIIWNWGIIEQHRIFFTWNS